MVAVQVGEGPMEFASHSVGFTAWGTSVQASPGGHKHLRPRVSVSLDDPQAQFDAAALAAPERPARTDRRRRRRRAPGRGHHGAPCWCGPDPRALLARLGVDPGGLQVEALTHNRWLTPGVWQVRSGGARRAVLKYVTADRDRGETAWDAHWTEADKSPRRWTYWLRESLAYRDGLVDAYRGSGVAAPECLGVLVDDREAVILLEWIAGRPAETWTAEEYGPAAEALGRAQAPFLAGRSLPGVKWLSQDFLRDYSSEKPVDWSLIDDDEAWDHPLVRATFPDGLREAVTLLHADRERLYQLSETLPRTLCHLDFWTKNLFRGPPGQITLIDWSFVGEGAIGEDVGNLVPDAAFDHFVAADELPHLEQVVFDSYVSGFRAAGWAGDPRLVRLGMWSAAVKYDWLAPPLWPGCDRPASTATGVPRRSTPRTSSGNAAGPCSSTPTGPARRWNSPRNLGVNSQLRPQAGHKRPGFAGERPSSVGGAGSWHIRGSRAGGCKSALARNRANLCRRGRPPPTLARFGHEIPRKSAPGSPLAPGRTGRFARFATRHSAVKPATGIPRRHHTALAPAVRPAPPRRACQTAHYRAP